MKKKTYAIQKPSAAIDSQTSTPAAPAAPATATSGKKLHLLLQSVASSLPRTSRESFFDPPFGFPLTCPAYEKPTKKAKSSKKAAKAAKPSLVLPMKNS